MKMRSVLYLIVFAVGNISAVVNWHNLSDTSCPGATNNGIEDGVQAAPVVDDNIDIIGTNALVDGVHVSAVGANIDINVSADSVLTGSGSRCDGVDTEPARLYLNAAAGRTITFNINNDLEFRGAVSNGTLLDLLVVIEGAGTVVFNLPDNRTVTFNSASGRGGTQVFVGSDGTDNPTLRFIRQSTTSSNDVTIVIGERSCLSYMSSSASGSGTIEFDNSNTDIGLMNVTVSDNSSFITVSHEVSTLTDPILTDINRAVTQGQAILRTASPSVAGSSILRIINENTVCTNLRNNPLCDNAFTGTQVGFILGPTGSLNIADLSYVDYIGTTTNMCCPFQQNGACGGTDIGGRLRNPSAFIVDGEDCVTTVSINFEGISGLYFRSGVNACGEVNSDFTVDPALTTPCAGSIVFDIEGQLEIAGVRDGSGDLQSGLNILSLEVTSTGCPILVGRTEDIFPARTFARDSFGNYRQYNKGAMLVNNRVNLSDTVLIHTDEIHNVYPSGNAGNCNLASDPTYIGGDTYSLCNRPTGRPRIKFDNSQFRVHTNVASTGVDFLVGRGNAGVANSSDFIFYNNGRCIDKGYGRNWILGTDSCFEGCCFTSADQDSYLNVFQDQAGAGGDIQLNLQTGVNTNCITEGIPDDTSLIANQCAVQTIFLNNCSNICVGNLTGNDECVGEFTPTIPSIFNIDGSCFSFETLGGCLGMPEASGTTGVGGMFIDNLGTVQVADNNITNFGMMVVQSPGATVDLPKRSVYFDSRVGITNWDLNLSDASQVVIVPAGQCLSEYNLDWGAITQNYCCTNSLTSTCFVPYEVKRTPTICECPPVTFQNLTSLPTVQGEVDQFQVLRSRICDQVHLNVDGGHIKELIFLQGCNSAEAPVGFIVVQNFGRLGIGSAHRNVDSLEASIKLGVNGVMLVANGDGCVELNEDILIDNVCHILSGTAFGATGENRLRIFSTTPKELRIKSTGTLDLTQFNTENKVLEIGGQVHLVAEPGARIILNGGILSFTDESVFELERVCDINCLGGSVPSDTDDIRVRMSGSGSVIMDEDSTMFVPQGSLFGIETFGTCSPITNIVWLLQDQASIHVGTEESPGGSFQVGDTSVISGATIDFQLILDGIGTVFQVDREGFFGMGAGIVNKVSSIPNNWVEANLANVNSVSVSVLEGTIRHDQILTGFSNLASLWAIGAANSLTFNYAIPFSVIRAGGNLALINSAALAPVNVLVDTTAGVIGATEVGIMAGKLLLTDPAKGAQPTAVTPQALFNYLTTNQFPFFNYPKGNAASDHLNVMTVGFVRGLATEAGSFIERADFNQGFVLGLDGFPVSSYENSVNIGAVALAIDNTSTDEALPIAIQGAGVF